MTFKLTIVILGVFFWVSVLIIKALDKRARSKRAAAQAGRFAADKRLRSYVAPDPRAGRFAAAPVIAMPAGVPYEENSSVAAAAQGVREAGGAGMSAAERAAQMRRDIGLMPSTDATQPMPGEPLIRSDLRRAVVMAEVLALPLALRRRSHAFSRRANFRA